MKTCTQCHAEKLLTEFNRRTKSASGYAEACKACHSAKTAVWYQQNKARRRVQSNARAADLRAKAQKMKADRGCLCCSERDPVCLDWHHLEPTGKEWNVSDVPARSWSAFLEEIKKCIVVCSNCHRKIHAGKIDLSGYRVVVA